MAGARKRERRKRFVRIFAGHFRSDGRSEETAVIVCLNGRDFDRSPVIIVIVRAVTRRARDVNLKIQVESPGFPIKTYKLVVNLKLIVYDDLSFYYYSTGPMP